MPMLKTESGGTTRWLNLANVSHATLDTFEGEPTLDLLFPGSPRPHRLHGADALRAVAALDAEALCGPLPRLRIDDDDDANPAADRARAALAMPIPTICRADVPDEPEPTPFLLPPDRHNVENCRVEILEFVESEADSAATARPRIVYQCRLAGYTDSEIDAALAGLLADGELIESFGIFWLPGRNAVRDAAAELVGTL